MADTSKYTIEERLIVSVWIHEKERTGETYEESRESFFLRFNKAAPVKPFSKKPRLHKVRQLAEVLFKRKCFNYSDGFCLGFILKRKKRGNFDSLLHTNFSMISGFPN